LYRLADEIRPDVVVVGSSHRGRVGQVLAGNVALGLLNGLDCPLAVAPAGYADRGPSLRTIGVGFDASPESRAALRAAGELAADAKARVRMIGVSAEYGEIAPYPWAFNWSGTRDGVIAGRLQDDLESAAEGLPPAVESSVDVQVGRPAAALAARSELLDLLVVGSRGYGPVRRLLLGSVSSELVRSAPCPVLVVPRPEVREDDEVSVQAEAEA
jgi:nucleotide-binding universal stress UspA family protein